MENDGDDAIKWFTYTGEGDVPEDVTHARVDPSVTVVHEGAFKDCTKLHVVELPEGVQEIAKIAFMDCKSLLAVNLPSTLEEIGVEAFRGCVKLEQVLLPFGLQRLEQGAFLGCKSLKGINIPPGIEAIRGSTFRDCHDLIGVDIAEGGVLTKIEAFAFLNCRSLEMLKLPSSIENIGYGAFCGCVALARINIPDSVGRIGPNAFYKCDLQTLRIPNSMTDVDTDMFLGDSFIVSLELPEVLTRAGGKGSSLYASTGRLPSVGLMGTTCPCPRDDAQSALHCLRNVALPPECAIGGYSNLRIAFPGNATHVLLGNALKTRFDELPIHKICYYQSYHDSQTVLSNLRREINPWNSKFPGQLNATGKQQDCLGMSPLHILACSTKPDVDLFRLLVGKYPETLIMKDKWEDIPLLYALWSNAPEEIVNFLVESYKSIHSEYVFDWPGMIKTLAKGHARLESVQRLLSIQQGGFPGCTIDMKDVVMELAKSDSKVVFPDSHNKSRTQIKTFQYLLRVSTTNRLNSLNVRRWREELERMIDEVSTTTGRVSGTRKLYAKLEFFETLKEASTILELALWKAKNGESAASISNDNGQPQKKQRLGTEVNIRNQCRLHCGAEIIIQNVMAYLLPSYAPVSCPADGSTSNSSDISSSIDSNTTRLFIPAYVRR